MSISKHNLEKYRSFESMHPLRVYVFKQRRMFMTYMDRAEAITILTILEGV